MKYFRAVIYIIPFLIIHNVYCAEFAIDGLVNFQNFNSNLGKKNNNKFFINGGLNFKFWKSLKNNKKYGFHVKLNPNMLNENNKKDQENIYPVEQVVGYFENKLGRFEVGNYTSISNSIDANTIVNFMNDNSLLYLGDIVSERDSGFKYFPLDTFFPTNSINAFGVSGKNSAKLNYYTPEFDGIRFAISYTPTIKKFGNEEILKNIAELGVLYTGEIENIGIKLSNILQFGKNKNDRKFYGWLFSSNMNYQGVSFCFSYGNLNKYNLGNINNTSKTVYWTTGFQYSFGPVSTNINYIRNKTGDWYSINSDGIGYKNLMWGLEYRIAKGISTYTEVSTFHFNNKVQHKENLKLKGRAITAGIKFKF
ncbi:MAG: hypothetical protein ACI8ZF_000436 [Candidatus Midichloriaceae bacterium]